MKYPSAKIVKMQTKMDYRDKIIGSVQRNYLPSIVVGCFLVWLLLLVSRCNSGHPMWDANFSETNPQK